MTPSLASRGLAGAADATLHSGDLALLLLLAGFVLITVECLRPGRVLPGAAGLLLALLGLHELSLVPLSTTGLVCTAAGVLCLVLSARPTLRWPAGAAGAALFTVGLVHIAASITDPIGGGIHRASAGSRVGLAVGLVISSSTWILLQVAARARHAKRLRPAPHDLALAWQPRPPE